MAASDDEHPDETTDSLLATEAITSPITETPSIAREWAETIRKRESALAAARQLLAETAEAITPAAAATQLLSCLTRYRAHLADLVAADTIQAPLVRTVEDTAAALGVSPWTVYQMVNQAELLTYRIARRCIRIDELALRDYLASREVTPLGPHRLTGYDIPLRHHRAHWQ